MLQCWKWIHPICAYQPAAIQFSHVNRKENVQGLVELLFLSGKTQALFLAQYSTNDEAIVFIYLIKKWYSFQQKQAVYIFFFGEIQCIYLNNYTYICRISYSLIFIMFRALILSSVRESFELQRSCGCPALLQIKEENTQVSVNFKQLSSRTKKLSFT